MTQCFLTGRETSVDDRGTLRFRLRAALPALLLSALLAACGGGGSDAPRPADGRTGAGNPASQTSGPAPASGDALTQAARSGALAAEQGGDYQAAAVAWGGVVRRQPGDVQAAAGLVRSLRQSGQPQAAIDAGQSGLSRLPDQPEIQFELAKSYLAADRTLLAVRSLQTLTTREPRDWRYTCALGVALDQSGQHEAARTAYNAALSLVPDHPVVLADLALSHAQSGSLALALDLARRAADQPQATAAVRQTLALLEALSGNAEAAIRLGSRDLPPDQARAQSDYYQALARARRPD